MRLIALFMLIAVLSACSAVGSLTSQLDREQNVGTCPAAGSLYDASRKVKFATADQQTFTNIAFTGEIVDVRMFCRYTSGQPVSAEVEIDFAFGKGPRAVDDIRLFRYWVVVARRSGKVLQKEYFMVEADFSEGDIVGKTELIGNIVIPRLDETISAANFEVLIGFDLTESELSFNQEGRRFRLSAGR
ncbi:MAG: hypothetical protein AAGJ84_07580 [Pseudomonadota bacterium]